MNLQNSKKLKASPASQRERETLPRIYPSSLSNNPSEGSSGIGRISAQSALLKESQSKQVKSESRPTQQIMIEFIPDKFFMNSSSEVNFIANPVIPAFSVPSGFPSINLN
jgi:hypothetical protein